MQQVDRQQKVDDFELMKITRYEEKMEGKLKFELLIAINEKVQARV
jgi:hypothetical protein